VTRGLAGLFYIDDSTNPDLPHRYGIDDIPIILQDRTFDSRGQFSLRGRAVTGALGDKILVNGTYNPHLPVTTRQVRLRILNASTARIYHLAFADDREFALIATDVGFLPSAQQTRRLLLSPAERDRSRPEAWRAAGAPFGALGSAHDDPADKRRRWQ
jgi:FtsP/CotA-like multicopper oxidase with cupredoxin domain